MVWDVGVKCTRKMSASLFLHENICCEYSLEAPLQCVYTF